MLFANKQDANLKSCVKMVEEAIATLGHSADEARLEVPGVTAWRVQKGSAHVYIMITAREHENTIRVTAPVMHLDPHVDQTQLFRRLLELNATQVMGAAFALDKNDVILTVERSTVDLDQSEMLAMLRHVEDFADRFDDILIAEFGGRSAGLSTTPIKS
jgi:hypothetical protein